MTWVRLDDQLADHPKIRGLGPFAPFAICLQIRALCYCARFLTDGAVPAAVVTGLTEGFDQWSIETATVPGSNGVTILEMGSDGGEFDWPEVMVKAGLWEKTDAGFLVHDYLKYNPSRKEILKTRQANAKRQAKFRESGSNGVTNTVTQPVVTASRNVVTNKLRNAHSNALVQAPRTPYLVTAKEVPSGGGDLGRVDTPAPAFQGKAQESDDISPQRDDGDHLVPVSPLLVTGSERARAMERLTTEGAAALAALLRTAPNPEGVVGEVNMILDGGRSGTPSDPAAVSLALADLVANGRGFGASALRAYVTRAAQGPSTPTEQGAWDALIAKAEREEQSHAAS